MNGIRAAIKKGFLDFLHEQQPDLLFLQEIKAQVDQYSREDMLVVVLRRNVCDICPRVSDALEEARYRLIRKTERGFSVLELNAEQNPEIAALMRQRDPKAPARLHAFYKGEKIYESQGISDDPRALFETLEMVQALSWGEVSIYDKYQPSRIFGGPHP